MIRLCQKDTEGRSRELPLIESVMILVSIEINNNNLLNLIGILESIILINLQEGTKTLLYNRIQTNKHRI